MTMMCWMTVFCVIVLPLSAASAADADSPLAPWRSGVTIRPVSSVPNRHSIHSYFNVCPESPDGRYVLFYTSTVADGERGEIRILERATGNERVLATNLHTEDAHRVACQQWLSGGKRVAFHDDRDGQWVSVVVDVATGEQRVLATDRLTGWGQPTADLLPLYGRHWNPGEYRNLEFADVVTGEIRTIVTTDVVKAAYPDWIATTFKGRPTSIFFPILSPDLNRVFFKMAAAKTDEPRSPDASVREGLIVYDVAQRKLLSLSSIWGHPSWRTDSRTILDAHNLIINSADGSHTTIPGLPDFGSGHPSTDPTGRLFVTDVTTKRFGGPVGEWAIALCAMAGGEHLLLHKFNNTGGAKSWRVSHPHPVFSADGKRLYFNISDGSWTRLYVAERE